MGEDVLFYRGKGGEEKGRKEERGKDGRGKEGNGLKAQNKITLSV